MRKIVIVALLLAGCSFGLAKQANTEPTSRVPVQREELPLPELDEREVAQNLRQFPSEAETVAKVEVLEAQTAAEVFKAKQEAKQEVYDQQKTRDIELAALEQDLAAKTKALAEQARASIFDFSKYTYLILVAAIGVVAYAAKRVNLPAAGLALLGFGFLFGLVFLGQQYPKLLAIAPLPFVALTFYVAWRSGVLERALVACVSGVEKANNDEVKDAIRKEKGSQSIEIVRKEIDKATVERAKAEAKARRESKV